MEKKKKAANPEVGQRKRRSDEEKAAIVRKVLASSNRTAEMKKLGIYPNQFYSWKKMFTGKGGERAAGGFGRGASNAARSLADEAKAYIQGKGELLERLRVQRAELDQLIAALEG
jgi:transposase-like protein